MIVLRLKHLAFERSSVGMPVRWKFSTIASTISTNHKTAAYLQQVESNISVALAFRQTVVLRKLDVLGFRFSVFTFAIQFVADGPGNLLKMVQIILESMKMGVIQIT